MINGLEKSKKYNISRLTRFHNYRDVLLTVLEILVITITISSTGVSQLFQVNESYTLQMIINALDRYKNEQNENCNTLPKINECLIANIEVKGVDFILRKKDEELLIQKNASKQLIVIIKKKGNEYKVAKRDDINVKFGQIKENLMYYDESKKDSYLQKAKTLNIEVCNLIEDVSNDYRYKGQCKFNWGRIYFRLKEYDNAIKELKNDVVKDFAGYAAIDLVGQCYTEIGADADKRGNLLEASNNYKLALDTFYEILSFCEERGKELKYPIYSNEAKDRCSVIYDSKMNIGRTYHKLKDYSNAIKQFSYVINYDKSRKNLVIAYFSRGIVYKDSKNYKEAIDDFDKVISLKKDYAEAYNLRGLIYKDLKQNEKAELDFKVYKELISNRESISF